MRNTLLILSILWMSLFGFSQCPPLITNMGDHGENFTITNALGNFVDNNNTPIAGSYFDHYNTYTVMQDAGSSFDFSVDFKGTTVDYAVWIDWNQDGVFDLSEQVFFQFYPSSVPNPIITGSITVPVGTALGDYRIRVRGAFTNGAGAIDPCAEYGWGESRDYKLTVPTPCAGTPIAGTATDISICENIAFNLSTAGVSPGMSGLTYQWEESVDQITWTDIVGATNATYAMTSGISVNTSYRLKVNCANGSTTDTSNILEVTLNPINQCYCIPEGTNASRFINNFSTTGGIQNISNLSTGFSTNGYGDFTSIVAEQGHGSTIDFQANVQGGTSGFRIWIDWNQNGSFEANEIAYQSNGYLANHAGTITVPVNALGGTTRMRVVSHYLSTSGDVSACATGFPYGEFEDYAFEVTSYPSCSGTPSAGTVADFSICAGEELVLATVGASTAESDLTYQWQESSDGITWTDISGATTATYTLIAGISVETSYRLIVTCGNGGATATSNPFVVSINALANCYCIPVITGTCAQDQVDDFTLIGENNTSIVDLGTGCAPGQYDDKTASFAPVELFEGSSYIVQVRSQQINNNVAVWIDFNDNGTFETSERLAFGGSLNNQLEDLNITIPLGTDIGIHRLRVTVANLGSTLTDACGTNAWGETHDYLVDIKALTSCVGTPVAGTTTDFSTCLGESFVLSTAGGTSGMSGLTYQWEESADQITWTDIVGATNATYAMTSGISVNTSYRLKVTCANGSATDTSSILEVTLNPASQCYCTPSGNPIGRYISSFSTTGGVQQISNLSSGESPNAYGDYTSMVASQFPGQDISLSVTIQGGSAGAKVWIDWDQSGTFESSEVVFASTGYQNAQSGTFTVPMTAMLGNTRMRVVSDWGSQTANIGPCATGYADGEFEDYTFEVLTLAACNGTPDAGTVVDFSVCDGEDFDLTTNGASSLESGLTYQWQESTDSLIWTDIAGATTIGYTVTGGVTTKTYYRLNVTCVNSLQTASSFAITVSMNAIADCYCIPVITGTCNSDQVDDFVLVGENSTSISDLGTGCAPADAYDDRTTLFTPVDLAEGVSYNAAIKTNAGSNSAALWIDFNDDGDFDATEVIGSGALLNGIIENVNISIPTGALLGNHRMRVIVAYNEIPADACGTYSWGETHDYLVNIVQSGVDCSTFTASISGDDEICEGETSTLVVTASAPMLSIDWASGEAGNDFLVTNSGTYTAFVESVEGCVDTVSFDVIVNPLPTVDGIDVTDNGTGSYTFAPIDAENATDYSWNFGGGIISTDENPTHVYTTEGTYTVTLTVSNDCGADSMDVTVIYEVSGIDENDLIALNIFPNPANDYVNIVNGSSFEMESISVVSPIGQLVFNDKISGNNYQLDVTQLANGLYHVNITLNNGNVVQRKITVIK